MGAVEHDGHVPESLPVDEAERELKTCSDRDEGERPWKIRDELGSSMLENFGVFREELEDAARSSRMLVVEDSDFFRQLVTPILGAAGYQVTAAPSAAEALRLREAGARFDAIVSDISMPDMDGLDFARAVRAGGPWARLPMIALSARAEPADIEAGRDAGFTDYVAKFERDALIASLRQCIAEPIAA